MENFMEKVRDSVLKETKNKNEYNIPVHGYNWDDGIDFSRILESYAETGFQATNFGKAVDQINAMITCRNKPIARGLNYYFSESKSDYVIKIKNNCTIFLGYTSNLVSSGLRETIKFLVQHKMIDCIVTTAGGVEEDFIKCLGETYLGDFNLDSKKLLEDGINRIGNLVIPNDNYRRFEAWIMPIFNEMVAAQDEGFLWTPSKMIEKMGSRINNEKSIYYWAAKNDIPVFCPAITDGSIGDMLFFHSCNNKKNLVIDLVSDINRMHRLTIHSINTGAVILGGGLVKHHIMNTNCMRQGANYSIYINTATEFDGSDAGARPDEAVTWGKIKPTAKPVKIYAEATLVFPLLVAKTFAKHYFENNNVKI